MTDTTKETVEALADRLSEEGRVYTHTSAGATLRALLTEREADHENINLKADFIEATLNDMAAMQQELDEALARNAALVEALTQIANEPAKMTWGEYEEAYATMKFMEGVADKALTTPSETDALDRVRAEAVKVKPLEWTDEKAFLKKGATSSARSEFGFRYFANETMWWGPPGVIFVTGFSGEVAAQANADEDNERRIHAALLNPPASEGEI